MYSYIRQWPKDREMGWSEECNGVCHDANNWFFTQNGNLWKFPITHSLNDSCKSENRAKGIYKINPTASLAAWLGGSVSELHLGDIDHYNGYIFVPVGAKLKKGNNSYTLKGISYFRASDLGYVGTEILSREDKSIFTSLGWLAINPRNGMLYTSDKIAYNETKGTQSKIHIYKIGDMTKSYPLTFHSTAILVDEYGLALKREHMQGGCFDDDNHLYILNGFVTHNQGKNVSWANSKGGISVFKVNSTPRAGGTQIFYRLTHSNQSSGFRYQFDGWGNEPEGLTYWDLDKDKRAPGIDGQLHAIMLDNVGTGADDFFFKHYRRDKNVGFYQVKVKTGNVDGAGTDAGVYVTFYGASGRTNEVYLGDSPRDDLERGQTDYYMVETWNRVGALNQILLRTDNKGKNAAWYVESVTVWDVEGNKTYEFPANLWMDGNHKTCLLNVKK